MVLGVIAGMVLATVIILATTALQLKKQKYVQQMRDMTIKHNIEKMVFTDRMENLNKFHADEIDKLQATIDSFQKQNDIAGKYKNGVNGFYSSKKKQVNDDDEDK